MGSTPMRAKPIKMGMMPARPGTFIREEIFAALGLSLSKAAGIIKVRRAGRAVPRFDVQSAAFRVSSGRNIVLVPAGNSTKPYPA